MGVDRRRILVGSRCSMERSCFRQFHLLTISRLRRSPDQEARCSRVSTLATTYTRRETSVGFPWELWNRNSGPRSAAHSIAKHSSPISLQERKAIRDDRHSGEDIYQERC